MLTHRWSPSPTPHGRSLRVLSSIIPWYAGGNNGQTADRKAQGHCGKLTSLDFLNLGVPSPTPSLGELLRQAKSNVEAWWISLTTFAVLVLMVVLINFIGEALLTGDLIHDDRVGGLVCGAVRPADVTVYITHTHGEADCSKVHMFFRLNKDSR